MPSPHTESGGSAGQPNTPANTTTDSAPTAKPVQVPLQGIESGSRAVPRRRVRRAPTVSTERGEWYRCGVAEVAKRAHHPGTFTVYDLALAGRIPEPPHPNMWGQLMSLARSAGLVVSVAAVPSSRPRTSRSLVRVWIGTKYAQSEGAA